jgi:multicomponent Na+:H+ antiporter subunit E
MKRFINIFITTFAVWAILSGFSNQELIAGLAVALIITVLLYKRSEYTLNLKVLGPFIFVLKYLPVFIIELFKANFDVAKRVVKSEIPVNPGFVTIHTSLKNKYAKLLLANSITLTPGTMTLDIVDDKLYIHWIDVVGENSEEHFKAIASKFEKIIMEVFNE